MAGCGEWVVCVVVEFVYLTYDRNEDGFLSLFIRVG
jgi:hypothetical protein